MSVIVIVIVSIETFLCQIKFASCLKSVATLSLLSLPYSVNGMQFSPNILFISYRNSILRSGRTMSILFYFY